ncbi:retrovirus-related pol polyprotein from transposon TNT 1-94 [Tanacetum coccineum]|uniref:Retrovirus-related pol polyprotein from transposon TNT 1-94 n=1 Tax=Tanacetum coccineum TaxID=301880 RepID=A0ABQ4XUB7_9ASTR
MAKASPTQAWLWHRRLSHLNFNYINLLSKKDVVIGLPKPKYVKDQLCSFCEVSKEKRSSFKTKDVPSSNRRLNFLHMDLCGPLRVASINGKKYILTLHAFFKEEGIEHQTSTPQTPEQNGVVERRNHTLVEAARTLLSASKLSLFFWAEAIATRTRLIVESIHLRFDEIKEMSETSVDNNTSSLVPQRQKASDYDNSGPESDKAPVVAAVVIEKSAVDEKDNSKVMSKVFKGKSLVVFKYKHKTELPKDNQKDNPKDKESDKESVIAAVMREKSDVDDIAYVIEKSTVIKESDKASVVKESDKVLVVKESDKAPVVAPILKEKPADVIEKLTVALDVVSKDKPKSNPPSIIGKGNAPYVVGKAKDKPSIVKGKVPTELPKKKHKADIPKDKPKPKDKHKVDSKVPILRSKPESLGGEGLCFRRC